VTPLPVTGRSVALVVAVDAFVERFRDDPGTRATYTETLGRLRAAAGDQLTTAALTPEIYQQVMDRWDTCAANTWNKHLSALNSFAAYCRRQDWLTTDPGRRLERRKATRSRDKAIPRARLDRLFTDDRHPLRERVLWRMLYETCARQRDPRPGRVRPGHGVSPRSGRREGRRPHLRTLGDPNRPAAAPAAGRAHHRAGVPCRPPRPRRRAPALADVDPETGRGRLSYPRAEYLFKQASVAHDPHGLGFTLHQLRHSGLTHLAARGRSAAELQAKSRHRHLGTLGMYVQLGEETSARITAENDDHHRRRRR
jgi:site-specific recombinase XerD